MYQLRNRVLESQRYYYRPVNIVATPVAHFQVRVQLTAASFDYSNVGPGGQDIRFVSNIGDQNYMPYWIESWNPSGTSILWVRVPSAQTSVIYMRYGDKSLTSASSIDATMETGLRFTYYRGTRAFTSLQHGGIDTQVSYNWGSGNVVILSGQPGIRADDVAIRWDGWVIPAAGGNHTFRGVSDDGIRMYITSSRTLFMNEWRDQSPTTFDRTVSLTAAPTRYEIEWYERGGGAVMQASWSGPHGGRQNFGSRIKAPKFHSSYLNPYTYTPSLGEEQTYHR